MSDHICKAILNRATRDLPEQVLLANIICSAVRDSLGNGAYHDAKLRAQEIADARAFFFDGRMAVFAELIDLHPDFIVGLMEKSKASWLKGKNGSNSVEQGRKVKSTSERAKHHAHGLGTRLSRGPLDTRW